MGQSTKLQSDPKFAKPHEAGARVEVTQILTHRQLGTIAYVSSRLWWYHACIAESSYSRLASLHDQVLAIEPDATQMRLIADHEMLGQIYEAGSSMVSNAVRTIQHLADEISRSSGNELLQSTVEARIAEAMAHVGLSPHKAKRGYQGFVEMRGVRDAIEHPTAVNVYSGDQNGWDRVPLAWMLSDRSVLAFENYVAWLAVLETDWQQYQKEHVEPKTLTIERGVVTRNQAKKAPRQLEGH